MDWYEGPPETVYERLREAVEQSLRGVVEKLHPRTCLRRTVEYVLTLSGKRIRPLLCLLASALEGGSPRRAVPAAAAVELVHTFTLVHDDIMDNSPMRRGQPTVHVRWGTAVAILTGDVLVGLAYELMEQYATHPFYAQLLATLTRSLIEVSEGQALDLELPDRGEMSLEDYWHMIDGKTVALLRGALLIGALVGELSWPTRHTLEQLALPLGRAFQLQDDLLDLVGDSAAMGKPPGTDLREGKMTYAVLRALQLQPAHELLGRYRQRRPMAETEIAQLIELFEGLGLLQEMQQQIAAYYGTVFSLLDELPSTPARELLRTLCRQLQRRRH